MQRAIVGLAAAIVLVCGLVPLVALLAQGASSAAVDVLIAPGTWRSFAVTTVTALAITGVTIVIGVPLGLFLSRTDVVGRRVLLVLHTFPMFVPPFLLALGWFYADVSSQLFSRAGLVVVLSLAFAPIVTVMTVLGLDGIDPAFDDAARVVARPRRIASRILLPLATPSIATGALVVFALAFAELGVPMFLRVDAYPAKVFARLGSIDYAPGEAFALVVPQLVLAALLLAIERTWIAPRAFDVLGLRRVHPPFALGRRRIVTSLACWLVGVAGLVPVAALAARAEWTGLLDWAGDSIRNSFVDAVIAASIMTACGIVLGHAVARGMRSARLLDAVLVLAFVTPAAALGAGLIEVWNRPSTQYVYTTSAIVIVGWIARYAVLAVRPLALTFTRGSQRLEDAAAIAGAGYVRRLTRIVMPVHLRAIGVTWLLCAVFCLRDLETAIVYYPPGRETLPIRIFTLEANGPAGVIAALSVVHVGMTAALLALALVLRRRS